MDINRHTIAQLARQYGRELAENCSPETTRDELFELIDEAADDMWEQMFNKTVNFHRFSRVDTIDVIDGCAEVLKYLTKYHGVGNTQGRDVGHYGLIPVLVHEGFKSLIAKVLLIHGVDYAEELPFKKVQDHEAG